MMHPAVIEMIEQFLSARIQGHTLNEFEMYCYEMACRFAAESFKAYERELKEKDPDSDLFKPFEDGETV